jgi:hypothetical protein
MNVVYHFPALLRIQLGSMRPHPALTMGNHMENMAIIHIQIGICFVAGHSFIYLSHRTVTFTIFTMAMLAVSFIKHFPVCQRTFSQRHWISKGPLSDRDAVLRYIVNHDISSSSGSITTAKVCIIVTPRHSAVNGFPHVQSHRIYGMCLRLTVGFITYRQIHVWCKFESRILGITCTTCNYSDQKYQSQCVFISKIHHPVKLELFDVHFLGTRVAQILRNVAF